MGYIKAFLYKELWDIKASWKKLIWISFIVLLPLLTLHPSKYSLIPRDLLILYFPAIVSFTISGQISLNSLMSEKRFKTLDIILCESVPKYSIVIGKIIPSVIIGAIYCLISFALLKGASIFVHNSTLKIEFNLEMLLIAFVISYFVSSVMVLVNLLVSDERFIPMIAVILGGIICYGLYKFNMNILLMNSYINLLIGIVITVIINFITIYILKHSSTLLTKL